MKKVHNTVENLLKNSLELRDSDKKLLLSFWEQEGLTLSSEQQRAFLNTTPAESITRARRSLRSQYPGSDKIEQNRYERFVETQDHYARKRYRFF